MLVQIDSGAPHEVSPVILQDYLLEQIRLQGWQIVSTGWRGANYREIECIDAQGGAHIITAKAEGE